MKLVIWAYPVTAINIRLVHSYDQPIDMESIEEESVWIDDFLPTIKKFCLNRNVDEALFIGPESFTKHLAEKLKNIYPDMYVYLGEEND